LRAADSNPNGYDENQRRQLDLLDVFEQRREGMALPMKRHAHH